jgi:spermidine synthase
VLRDRSFIVVAICFFLSGFAALIYETAWTREFSFVFGTSELAIATVLAAYMAGLAGGAAVGGRIAEKTTRPLALYAFLELGIGIAALLVPVALWGATQLLIALFGQQSEFGETNPLAISAFYLVTTFVIVMVPTSFMGATLPLLARQAVRHDSEIGTRVGALYSINTAGAVAGTLTAAFLLLPSLGIRETVYVAVAANALVFLIATVLVRSNRASALAGDPGVPNEAGVEPASTPASSEAQPGIDQAAPRRMHFILPLILLSGALSFVYEVLWARLLSQLLGGSVYAFTTMLASFLLGIALGSAVASRLASSKERALRLFAFAQVGIALLTGAAFGAIDHARVVIQFLGSTSHLFVDVVLAMMVLLPAAVCIGATFPFAVRILARDAEDAGPSSARVYSWNTVGSIAGSIGCAFFLLPLLGFRGTIALGITINLALAGAALFFGRQNKTLLAIPAVAALLLALFLPGEPWRVLRSSPLNRFAPPKAGAIEFYQVGRGATVLLAKNTPSQWRLTTNGLPESMISAPEEPPTKLRTAVLLGTIGPLLRPEARSMLVVGLGGGVTLEQIPANIKRIDVIEIEEEVVAANRWLGPRRAVDPLADPRVHLHINDARSALLLSDQKFDVIAAQASHPWTGGASHLYTGDFFKLVADHLSRDGVFVQWVGRNFIDLDLVKTLVGTLQDEFEHVQVYQGLLFVASNAPLPNVLDLAAIRAQDPAISRRTGIYSKEQFAVNLLMDSRASRAFSKNAELTSDDRNLLQMRSPKILQASPAERAEGQRAILKIWAGDDPLRRSIARGKLSGVDLVLKLRSQGRVERAKVITDQLRGWKNRESLQLLGVANATQRPRINRYLKAYPDDALVRAQLLRLNLARPDTNRGSLLPGGELRPAERSVIAGNRQSKQGAWGQVAFLEKALAKVTPSDPLYLEAIFLRANWRLNSGKAVRFREVIEMVDEAFRATQSNRLLLLRSRAAESLSDPRAAIASLFRIRYDGTNRTDPGLRNHVRLRLTSIQAEGEDAAWRDQLLQTQFRIAKPGDADQEAKRASP